MAEQAYRKALEFNEVHYKALVGLEEVLSAQSQQAEAYDVIKKLVGTFPVTPARLMTALRLAVVTENYEDIIGYYQKYLELDTHPEDVIRVIVAALIVTGKHLLLKGDPTRAIDVFQKALVTSGWKPRVIRQIVSHLTEYKQVDAADAFFKRFPSEEQGGTDYRLSRFYFAVATLPVHQTIEAGRPLVQEGVQDQRLFEEMIRAYKQAGFKEAAEEAFDKAQKIWPNLTEQFDQIYRG